MTISSESNATPSGIGKSWRQRVLAQPDRSLPKSTLFGLRQVNHGLFLIHDRLISSGETLWTDDQSLCQTYHSLTAALQARDILARISGKDIEVVTFDGGSLQA